MHGSSKIRQSVLFQTIVFFSITSSLNCGKDKNSTDAATSETKEIIEEILQPQAGDANPSPADGEKAKKDEADKAAEALLVNGTALYAKHCASCHGELAASEVRGKNIAEISDAMIAIPDMKALGSMPAIDLASIAKALQADAGEDDDNGKGKGKDQGKGKERSEEAKNKE